MRIVSWNCNGAFRKKYQHIMTLNADIYVIQECEPPSKWTREMSEIVTNYIWEPGLAKNGVLVFAKLDIKLTRLPWKNHGMKVFIPIMVNDLFKLVAVWTTKNAYIEDFFIWQSVYADEIDNNTVIIGDFNSNAIWDKDHGEKCHTNVVNSLYGRGLNSVYHYVFHELQGEESKPTYYAGRHVKRPYHIDDCYANAASIQSYDVLSEDWLQYSDHVPIVFVRKD